MKGSYIRWNPETPSAKTYRKKGVLKKRRALGLAPDNAGTGHCGRWVFLSRFCYSHQDGRPGHTYIIPSGRPAGLYGAYRSVRNDRRPPGRSPVGLGVLPAEPLFPGGLAGIAGSMLIVMFTYAGFEVIGLAASEAHDPHRTIPRAILYTILGLVGLYSLAILVLLPLVRTSRLTESVSPLVAGLTAAGLNWAAGLINIVLVVAILSTMLAAMFGMGRMVRSLAEAGYAPLWLKESSDVPVRGILFSGAGMLAGVALSLGYLLPSRIYLFLISSGGFSLLFTYVIIMATHYKYRKVYGCPPTGHCQLRGYPYTTLLGLAALIAIIVSMPLVPGQGFGLLAGILLVFVYFLAYIATMTTGRKKVLNPLADMESGEELSPKEVSEETVPKRCD